MAKSSIPKRTKPSAVGLKRKLVARDEQSLSPVFVDFSTIVLSGDMVIQNFFQTVLPAADPQEGGEVDAALVARFVYSPTFFKALMSLLVRQYVISENIRGRKDEAVTWLKQLLKQVESGDSTGLRQPTTVQ